MNTIDLVLIVTVVTSSLFVGVIAAMMSVIQKMLNQLDYATYTPVMQSIITSGRRSVVIWVLLLIPVFSGGTALFLLRSATGTPAFLSAVVGLILFIAGPILVSRFGNEPWYDRIMTWNKEMSVTGWERDRQRWLYLNRLRFGVGCAACVAFAVSLATYST